MSGAIPLAPSLPMQLPLFSSLDGSDLEWVLVLLEAPALSGAEPDLEPADLTGAIPAVRRLRQASRGFTSRR